jgi:branched-chain amino acid transport system permease protein
VAALLKEWSVPLGELLFVGISQGCVYGLVALGFVLIYKSTEMINFAQGDLAILGAYLAIAAQQNEGFSFWFSIPLVVMGMFGVGYVLDRLLIRQLLGHPPFSVVIFTISLGLVVRALVGIFWGYEPRGLAAPFKGTVSIMGTNLDASRLTLIFVTISIVVGLIIFFRFSRFGLAMRAASQNQLAAFYVGIPVKRLYSISWGMGAALAAVAGIMLATTVMIDPHSGFIGIKAFAAAVIGGLGSLMGAMLGGLLVGVAEQLAGAYLPSGSQESVTYVIMLLVLVIRPHGLLSQVQLKKA